MTTNTSKIITPLPEIVLIRGLPGAGKSTLARSMTGYVHIEADAFLYVNGRYIYDRQRVSAAHDECYWTAKAALAAGLSVVVANTFVMAWEMQRYIDLGFPFRIIEAKGPWSSTHDVPPAKLDLMRSRWEPVPERFRIHHGCKEVSVINGSPCPI